MAQHVLDVILCERMDLDMEEIFKQYGGPIITVLVIVSLLAIMAILLASNNGLVMNMFSNLTNDFFSLANLNTTRR